MKHADGFEAFMRTINPTQTFSLKDAPVQPYPRFANLEDFQEGKSFTVSIPTVRRTWWIVGLVGLAFLWIVLPPLSVAWGFVAEQWGNDSYGRWVRLNGDYWTPAPVVATIFALSVLSWQVLKAVFPRIKIEADKDEILVGGYRYSWDRAAGLRAGYALGGKEKSQTQWKFTGLRLAYGDWGHDLPYMVRDYYSVAYVYWINQLLGTIKHGSESVNDPAKGIKQQLY